MEEDQITKQRKDQIIRLVKRRYDWISYVILAIIVFLAVRLRTLNLSGLRDVTTGGWTLGPDLDPFLFLRWAKYIVENGSLYAVDHMRYVPLGFSTKAELLLHPYMIAWFHKVAVLFGSGSVEQSAAIYPVFFFALTVIAFFFFARELFINRLGKKEANAIALIASFFLITIPSLLPRTIAGIPEKESAAFFFLFAVFYLFLKSWKAEKRVWRYSFAVLSGLLTAGMALVWGGYIYVFITLGFAIGIAFLLGQVEREKVYIYALWIISAFLAMSMFSTRYTFKVLLASVTTASSIFVFFIIVVNLIIYRTKLKKYFSHEKLKRWPPQLIAIGVALILGLIGTSIMFGPSYVFDKASELEDHLITPVQDRLGVTVAENRQPFFGEWAGNFGPSLGGFPVFFWIFLLGSVYLFFNMLKTFRKRERWMITASYVVFLFAIIFSRYSSSSVLNGTNFASIALYAIGVLAFVGTSGYYYYDYYRKGRFSELRKIDFGFILLFAFFFISIVSARGAVRLVMVLVPSTSIIAGYFAVDTLRKAKIGGKKDEIKYGYLLVGGIVTVLLIYSGYFFYNVSAATAQGYVPGSYNQQWQQAMGWVRDNTSEDSIFAHWWDYGYWVQSIGDRATIVDGGNVIVYWNYLVGRHALTGSDNMKAAEVLYAHGVTHFLIDSSDIGKYTAFSSIGSDENYDRRSWINTLLRDSSQTQEKKDSKVWVYTGGSTLDGDIIYVDENGKRTFLPGVNAQDLNKVSNVAVLAGILVEVSNDDFKVINLTGVYYHQNVRYDLPLRYVYDGEFRDLGEGIDAGVFIMPSVTSSGQIDGKGALLYLSNRTVKSQLARLYLYGEDNDIFKIAHVEDNVITKSLEAQGIDIGSFLYYGGFQGPIKIWEMDYPDGIEKKDEYLQKHFPGEDLLLK